MILRRDQGSGLSSVDEIWLRNGGISAIGYLKSFLGRDLRNQTRLGMLFVTKQQSLKRLLVIFCSCDMALYRNMIYVTLSMSLGDIVLCSIRKSQSDSQQG